MGRKEKDTSILESIPIIHEFLTDDCLLNGPQIRSYMLNLAVIYPYIMNAYSNFETFLALKPNKKAAFFDKFVETEYALRMKRDSDRDKVNCRNRVLRIMWGVQGFLGHLSGIEGANLKANKELLEVQLPNPHYTIPVDISDLLDLFDEMPGEGRRRIKLLFWTTWNGIDLVNLSLSDFEHVDTEYGEYFWVSKRRKKTRKKNIIFGNLFTPPVIRELERHCSRKGLGINDSIFSRDIKDEEGITIDHTPLNTCSLRAYFKYWAAKTGLNQFVGPKNIRALGMTQLRPIFKDDVELLNFWTQHNTHIVTKHYTKDLIERFAERMPKIQKAVGIENVTVLTEKIKHLEEDVLFTLDMHQTEINQLKQKKSTAADERAGEAADEIIDLVKRKLGMHK